tara:strand:- start:69 stop:866 length:798 start_codon:yes stop_codon:yes gene_type:complete
MIDPNLRRIVIDGALKGCNKTSLHRTLQDIVGLPKKKADALMRSLPFRKKPFFINYLNFYKTKISPNATQIKFPFTQIYIFKDFLRRSYCNELISIADEIANKSSVSNSKGGVKYDDYRTSSTADMDCTQNKIVPYLDDKIASALNISSSLGESLQIQKYLPGQYYKEHADYYSWFTPEHKIYTEWMGQRTWTCMVYLNDVEQGGETIFKHLNLKIKPQRGMAVLWNNLWPIGIPNYKTMHEALPPISGNKYVITKWFRSWSLIP